MKKILVHIFVALFVIAGLLLMFADSDSMKIFALTKLGGAVCLIIGSKIYEAFETLFPNEEI